MSITKFFHHTLHSYDSSEDLRYFISCLFLSGQESFVINLFDLQHVQLYHVEQRTIDDCLSALLDFYYNDSVNAESIEIYQDLPY